ncbi:MAG: exopolysaccharide biosynthesis polyprenyl glycosylphosphotransferase [Candidatus Caenarcaniphilales bacterium]|nr:exopolysaccharide biosynthesis polyprenyl glycosylphosphotransferase [Candidatus Caenarcaniphilales bacterium]
MSSAKSQKGSKMFVKPKEKILLIAKSSSSLIAISNLLNKRQKNKVIAYFDPNFSSPSQETIFQEILFSQESQGNPISLTDNLPDLKAFVIENKINSVYISLSLEKANELQNISKELSNTSASIHFLPDLSNIHLINPSTDSSTLLPSITIRDTPFKGINAFFKRLIDIVFSIIIILFISPVLFVVSIAIKLTSQGPIIFKQKRNGFNGKEIIVYKFRTMKTCEKGEDAHQAKRNDSRVTKLGSFLRKTSLDELPQFFNVLEGSMSIVGPRPHPISLNNQFQDLVNDFWNRHLCTPGITGLAQINNCRGETSTVEKMRKRINYDIQYLSQWSLFMDIKIIIATAVQVFKNLFKKAEETEVY